MTLPMSKYEELLETVRNLKQQTIRVRELASPLLDTIISANNSGPSPSISIYNSYNNDFNSFSFAEDTEDDFLNNFDGVYHHHHQRSVSVMESLLMERQQYDETNNERNLENFTAASHVSSCSEPEKTMYLHREKNSINPSSNSAGGTWPIERISSSTVTSAGGGSNMWHSEPSPLNFSTARKSRTENQKQLISPNESVSPTDMNSVMSFASSSGAAPFELCLNNTETGISDTEEARQRQQQLDVKVDMVYSLLAVLGTSECPDMGETLLALSSSPDSSRAMRQAGCLSVLVQLVHAKDDESGKTREKAAQALRNLVQGQADERQKKRELKVLKLLEDIRLHCANKGDTEENNEAKISTSTEDNHPTQSTENIIKLSFDEGYRHTICELGGIYTLARLIEVEHMQHGSLPTSDKCITLRRYGGMALTNLTFGHGHNKSLLCSFSGFMRCLVAQLSSTSDELRQVTASVLRNLSWRADSASRTALRDAGAVAALMQAAMRSRREATLKSVLSALWNLSAHCSTNKADICAVPGALAFLVDMLGYRPPSRTLTIIENAGGILRNVSSHIAIRDDYRSILREKGCLPLLLQQLKSPSLTVVSNACGTLWNLSAKCEQDQQALWDMGAAPMLRSLNHSKHVMIATGSRAALKNLLSSRPAHNLFNHVDSTAREMGLPALPTLGARKKRALAKDLDQNLSEICYNIEPTSPPQLLSPLSAELASLTASVTTSSNTNCNINSRKHQQNFTSDENIVESFSNLSLTSKTTVVVDDDEDKSKFIPIRNKLCEFTYEYEQDNSEQPVDYSQKYAETKSRTSTDLNNDNLNDDLNEKTTAATGYTDYAETDLDQPTNYSLRYAENDSDSEDVGSHKNETIRNRSTSEQFYEGQLDTIKTYCTEGTPYETPLNFSTATSMSDLRQIDTTDDKKEKDKKKCSIPVSDKQITVSYRKEISNKKVKSGFSSGLMTPEKPVKYCEEGTPRSFSRHSSFSSLNLDDPQIEQNTKHESENTGDEQNGTEKQDNIKIEQDEIDMNASGGGKVVTFGTVVDCSANSGSVQGAEETPLMFSRCSSLGSLSSAEQHSIHDDRSSIISDFSRLTSGIVSPSELPDSPTQTVPPSPRQRRAPVDFPTISPQSKQLNQHQQQTQNQQPKSVFEDNVIKFKEVNTPIEFSTNTSLSSLTIDDEPVNINFNLLPTSIVPGAGTMNTENIKIQGKSSFSTNTKNNSQQLQDKNDTLDEDNEDADEQAEDDMLAACINIGIQNNRHRQNKQETNPLHIRPTMSLNSKYSPRSSNISQRTGIPVKSSSLKPNESKLPLPMSFTSRSSSINEHQVTETIDTMRVYCTEDTPAMLSHAGSHSDLSILSIESSANPHKLNQDKTLDLSDDSSNLSGDNESNILAECIQSGMPKSKRQLMQPKTSITKLDRDRLNGKNQFDMLVSCSSSSSSRNNPIPSHNVGTNIRQKITKNVMQYGLLAARDEIENYAVEDSPCQFSLRSSLSDLTVDGVNTTLKFKKPSNKESEQQQPTLSRAESLSSLSVESYGSTENAEQVLLEQCISSGMPSKHKNNTGAMASTAGLSPSKNVQAASVALSMEQKINNSTWTRTRNAPVERVTDEDIVVTTTTIEDTEDIIERNSSNPVDKNTGFDNITLSTTIDKRNEIIENFTSWHHETKSCSSKRPDFKDNLFDQEMIKNNHDVINKCSDILLDGSIEENVSAEDKNIIQNRMLDPDAMIESLDRFTAELVSQSSHLQHSHEHERLENKLDNNIDTMQQSGTNNDTWNEDTSPNDVSFPSISVSAPLVASFASESVDTTDGLNSNSNENNQDRGQQPASLDTTNSTMTDSTLIAMEATKIVNSVRCEVQDMQQSITSIDLDHIKPPSVMMDSFMSLTSSISESPRNSPVASRKRSLPAGLMVRRALSITGNSHMKSLENINQDGLNSCISSCSNLDYMKPPSVMAGDFLDLVDMENSMISVASITSEVEDKINFDMNLQDLKQNDNSITDIENIGPPSLLQEVTDMCNSTVDINTENIYSETEVFEDCLTHVADQTIQNTLDEVTITEYSDANSLTPVQSDFASSSAESTPKKLRNNLNNRMTPKQRRQLAKERYKTYTVAAEMVIREECKQQIKHTESDNSISTETLSECNFITAQSNSTTTTPTIITAQTNSSSSGNGKLTPKERRQLDRERFQTRVLDSTNIPVQLLQHQQSSSGDSNSSNEFSKPNSRPSSRTTIRQRRLENKERFRTRTLSNNSNDCSEQDDLHLLLAQEANIVLETLQADQLLDCETLSLVSNDDESEHNSVSSINYRTYHKSWGFSKNLPVVNSTNDTMIKQQLQNKITVVATTNEMQQLTVNESTDDKDEKPVLETTKIVKPKIVKPNEASAINDDKTNEEINEQQEEQAKTIRGKRKPLYSSPNKKQIPTSKLIATKNLKPLRTMTSNLVKNVTTSIKTNTINKFNSTNNKLNKPVTTVATNKPASNLTPFRQHSNITKNAAATKTKPNDIKQNNNSIKQDSVKTPKPLERQGTFTKDDKKTVTSTTNSKIPESRIPMNKARTQSIIQSRTISSTSRSPSADRDFGFRSKKIPTTMHPSSSSQSLQGNESTSKTFTSKRSSIPNMTHRSNSNISITSTDSTASKRKPAVASRIASLWKKSHSDVGEIKKKSSTPAKPIQKTGLPVIANGTNVKMRKKTNTTNSNDGKRLSRLGSFIQVEEIPVT